VGVAATRTRRAMLAHWCVKGYGVAEILLFDLYGTLVDPLAIAADLTEVLGADGSEVSRQWRAKQLEFSFRLTVMGSYLGFRAVTAAALEFALASAGLALPAPSDGTWSSGTTTCHRWPTRHRRCARWPSVASSSSCCPTARRT
jgi:hypothetical protein